MSTSGRYRAIVHLRAKAGQEQALLAFCLEAAPAIRKVDGLQRLEINRALDDPARLVLYYEWLSPEHSGRYVAGPLYASIMPKLGSLVQEHSLLMTENLSA